MSEQPKPDVQKEELEPLCIRKRKCLQEMREIIRLIGPWSVSKSQMARKYHVDWNTAQNWFTRLLKEIPREQIDNIKIMGEASQKQALAVCEKILADPNSKVKDKLDAADRITEIMKRYTEFLEQYNMKPKVADELNVGVSGNMDIQRLLKIAQEARATTISTGEKTKTPAKTLDISDTSTPKKATEISTGNKG